MLTTTSRTASSSTVAKTVSFVAALAGLGIALAPVSASARAVHHGARSHSASHSHKSGVSFANADPRRGGYQALVSDGQGSGFGFHHNPGPFRIGAAIARGRQVDAVHSAVIDSAVDSQPHGYGFYGDSVYGNGNSASYGVFNGSDGYGSPYFAGYYGSGDGADYGVFGHAYSN